MKHTLELHYSVRNGGDGSAYPTFMESAELAEWDQEQMDEGWGETCTGSIMLRSDSPIEVLEDIQTKHTTYLELMVDTHEYLSGEEPDENDIDKINEFISKFFPNGVPFYTLEKVSDTRKGGYVDYNFLVDGVVVHNDSTCDPNPFSYINNFNQ